MSGVVTTNQEVAEPGRPLHRRTRRPALGRSAGLSQSGQWALLLLFGLVLFDSMGSYLLANLVGIQFRVNALAPVLFVLLMLRWGIHRFIPPALVLIGITFFVLAFLVGVFVMQLYGWNRILSIASIVAAILIGYGVGRWVDDASKLSKVLLTAGLAYSFVCVLALLGLTEALPVRNAEGFRDGVLVLRPEVMTDQNFQVFYLFFLGLLFLLPYRALRFWLTFAGTLAAAYVLSRLYTRSGALLLIGALTYAWLTPLFYRRLGRTKVIILPLLLLMFLAWQWETVANITAQIIFRFTDAQSYGTLHGRIFAVEYLFAKLPDPAFWLPQGNAEFVKLTKNIPHFNPTAIYLQGGLFGLIAWTTLVPIPLVALARHYFARRLDEAALLVFGAGLVLFVGQLSLNIPLFDQVWLWAGCVAGCLYRVRRSPRLDVPA